MRGLHLRHFSCVLKLLFEETLSIQFTQGNGQISLISVCLWGKCLCTHDVLSNCTKHSLMSLLRCTSSRNTFLTCLLLQYLTLYFSQKTILSLKAHFSLKIDAIKVFKYHQIAFTHHSMKSLSLTSL